jgi:PucR C-terminal helix-turn-helix domain
VSDPSRRASDDSLRSLREGLDARRPELEQAALDRIAAIADPAAAPDPTYVAGLRAALATALDYGFAAIAVPQAAPGPVPIELLSQARLAARNGVSLDAVLRRYAAGHSLLTDGLLEEAAAVRVGAAELKDVLRALALHYDRIVVAVSEEYERETTAEPRGAEHRRYALLRRLLAGEPLDAGSIGYHLDAHHLAIVAFGEQAGASLAKLGERLDRRLLLAEPDLHTAWAWLGGRRRFDCSELDFIASFPWPEGSAVACGEAGHGVAGWRLSHRQAAAALPVAQRGPATFVRYADVALLAAVLRDDLLAVSLRQAYLTPLEGTRDGGRIARETLRAYFATERNISSTAAALGVDRGTVRNRIRMIEELLGRSVNAVATELELALRLDQ